MEIRNIAIIAHVDHGKTTLTDMLMKQSGLGSEGVSMDSNALEKERGITIYSKNTSLFYPSAASGRAITKINIVDTPGHADFGSEVERVLRSIDCVLLLIDAQEGPMPQTRFVLKKSLELGLKPIVVINKIDKPAADPKKAVDKVFELFLELGANDEQADFSIIYANGREGVAKKELTDNSNNLNPLLDTILEKVQPANSDTALPLRMQVFNLAYDNFLGRMAIARIYEGILKKNTTVYVKDINGEQAEGKIIKIFTFHGSTRVEVEEAMAGDIVIVAGLPNIYIGKTVTTNKDSAALPAIAIDEPTITLNFLVNNSPFAGQDGKLVTSRQIRERLERELEVNVGLKIDFNNLDYFKVSGRGELHIAILLENMRREGFEIQVSQPRVIIKEENNQKLEPFEEVTVDVKEGYQGIVIEKLGGRAYVITDMQKHDGRNRVVMEGPTRGLLGYRNQFLIDTKGEGIIYSRVIGFKPYAGEIKKRQVGSMISMASGKVLGFSLWNLQERGVLYITPNIEVYEGMVIGNTSKGEEMMVNPTKGKQLSNMRSSGTDEKIELIPPLVLSIERGLEVMSNDEYLEITPHNVRLRKIYLTEIERTKTRR